MTAKNRTQRRDRLERIYVRSPVYFVTTCTPNRRRILGANATHESFIRFAEEGPEHGAWIGAYVLMPDHLHAFVVVDDEKLSLSQWMKSLKNALSKTMRPRGFQCHTGKKHFSITCSGAPSPTRRNGITCARIRCERDW
jgi:REP element-mobilizing transposase RayT